MKNSKIRSQKIFSVLITVVLLFGMLILPVSAEQYPIVGTIIDENFESYQDGNRYTAQKDGFHFTRGLAYIKDLGDNKVWNLNPSQYPGYTGMHQGIELNQTPYEQVNTGRLLMEYDLMFPIPAEGKQMEGTEKIGHFIISYNKSWSGMAPNENRAYLAYSQLVGIETDSGYSDHKAQIWFPVTDIGYPADKPLENAVDLSLDTWHHITHEIDYEKGTMYHYVDDVLVAQSSDNIANKAAFYQTYIYSNISSGLSADFTSYMDNMKIERVPDLGVPTAKVTATGENYVDITFGNYMDGSGIIAADFQLQDIGGNDLGAPDTATIEDNVLRITSTKLQGTKAYRLTFLKDIPTIWGPEDPFPAGENFWFFVPDPDFPVMYLQDISVFAKGKVRDLADVIPAMTTKITLTFNSTPASDYLQHLGLQGGIGLVKPHRITTSGNTVSFEFDEYMEAETPYTLTIDSGLTNTAGQSFSEPMAFHFTTDSGEFFAGSVLYTRYDNPANTMNQNNFVVSIGYPVGIDVTFTNTTAYDQKALLCVAIYQSDILVATNMKEVTLAPGIRHAYLSVAVPEGNGFPYYQLKPMVLESLDTMKPMLNQTSCQFYNYQKYNEDAVALLETVVQDLLLNRNNFPRGGSQDVIDDIIGVAETVISWQDEIRVDDYSYIQYERYLGLNAISETLTGFLANDYVEPLFREGMSTLQETTVTWLKARFSILQ